MTPEGKTQKMLLDVYDRVKDKNCVVFCHNQRYATDLLRKFVDSYCQEDSIQFSKGESCVRFSEYGTHVLFLSEKIDKSRLFGEHYEYFYDNFCWK